METLPAPQIKEIEEKIGLERIIIRNEKNGKRMFIVPATPRLHLLVQKPTLSIPSGSSPAVGGCFLCLTGNNTPSSARS